MPQYSAHPPLPWSIPRLSTAHLFGVAAILLVLSTSHYRCLAHIDRMPVFHTNRQPFILPGIQPTELRRQITVLFLVCCAQELKHLLYKGLLSPLGGQLRQLKSRHLIVPAALELLNDPAQSGTSIARWSKYSGA